MLHNRKQNMKKKRFWQRLQALFLIVFITIFLLIGIRFMKTHARRIEEASAKESMEKITTAVPSPSVLPADNVPPSILPEFNELIHQNQDFVGMVSFGDMSLYVCQTEDNFYYASHRFDGSEDKAGMIYMDFRNSILPASDNIVLYGHNMKDGSRFGTLNRYESVDYLLENPAIRLATLYEAHDYYPIAVFYTSAAVGDIEYFDFARPNFADEADFDRYIRAIKARSLYYIPTDAQYGDRLLTLATCSESLDRGRLVVVCRKSR